MKIFSSELGHNYDSYTFGYVSYCLQEAGDSLADIYALGYLPYSGSRGVPDTLYMARSARVRLREMRVTSENRRIAKKFDEHFTKERVPLQTFDASEEFYVFCLEYFSTRHGANAMSRERLEFILHNSFISHVIVYKDNGKPVAYVFEMRDGGAGHYWYSFYNLALVQQSLGMWLILDCVRDAKEAGLEYYYLGTVYGQKALYKTNFGPLEWWDGSGWKSDIKLLRERGRTDEKRIIEQMDAWKEDKEFFN
ncbi:MAG: GNAT family N-acetyltransferase [bacterium]|nr:GNAT family N-acetyltransferase [bacterium]